MSKIDRHAVLRFDPTNFAAEGCAIFNIYGNGLEDIKDVELRAGATKLTPVGSLIQNWEFVRFAFDFAGKDIQAGKHILALTFDDGIGSETLEREFTISEPVSGEINPITIKVICYSPTIQDLYPDDENGNPMDELFYIGLVADPDMKSGEYQVEILDVKFVLENGNAHVFPTEPIYTTITVKNDMTLDVEEISVEDTDPNGVWYDLNGRRVEGRPSPGTYIFNGRKVTVK